MDKPEWYILKISPTGKIPAITYGGPRHPPEEPSPARRCSPSPWSSSSSSPTSSPPQTFSPATPSSALKRASSSRLSIADSKVVDTFRGFFFMGAPASELFATFEAFQALLPPTGFAVGEWSIADIAVGPYLVRMLMLLEHEIGKYPIGEGKKTLEILRGKRFERIMKYVEDVKAWPSFRAT